MFDVDAYCEFFRRLNGFGPYEYQVDLARRIIEGQNVVLRAPTGAGKTAAVVTPFLFNGWTPKPCRLIYVLPLRALVQSIHVAVQEKLGKLGLPQDLATIQTGEQPDDPFLDRGRVIVTTFDQLLSGLLGTPYGLSSKLHNVNGAAVAGALVVFDEFHLMEPTRAFLTAVAALAMFGPLCQSVWMTATATQPLVNVLEDGLGCQEAELPAEQMNSLPSVEMVRRELVYEREPLTAEYLLRHPGRRIAIVNTVDRAQTLFQELVNRCREKTRDVPVLLLHSRFVRPDRQAKEKQLCELFGRAASGPAILVSTQAIEAGLDLTSDHLFTEECPVNSLVQRAGRCARFEGQSGVVHVHPLPDEPRSWLPYGGPSGPDPALERTNGLLRSLHGPIRLTPDLTVAWVQQVHGPDDEQSLRSGWRQRQTKILQQIAATAVLGRQEGVAHLIREADVDEVRVIVARAHNLPERPGQREAVSVSRWQLVDLLKNNRAMVGWWWDTSGEPAWSPLTRDALRRAYIVCLEPKVARYTAEVGLELGKPGGFESPERPEPRRPGHPVLRAEEWVDHAKAVAAEAERRAHNDGVEGWLRERVFKRLGLTAEELCGAIKCASLFHDLGKLQMGWQQWAEAAQRAKQVDYRPAAPLAHTDFDPDSPEHRRVETELRKVRGLRRPPHAAVGAYLALPLWMHMLAHVHPNTREVLISACAAAVVGHHGGWLPGDLGLGLQRLAPGWKEAVQGVSGLGQIDVPFVRLYKMGDRRGYLERCLSQTMHVDSMSRWWPLVAYLTRTLRLADQRATAEGGEN